MGRERASACPVDASPKSGGVDEWSSFAPEAFGLSPLISVQEAASLVRDPMSESAVEREQLAALAGYVLGYLTRPDREVGRAGPVCPFTPGALRRRTMLLAAWRSCEPDAIALTQAMRALLAAFLRFWGPDDGHDAFRSVSVVMPGLDVSLASSLVQEIHDHLKPEFVARGLMFGEFYPDCDAPGLRNPSFRPLRTPVPNLTIRPMTVSDEPFLSGDPTNLSAYRSRFPGRCDRMAAEF